nr:MFS transporter [uncultured Celeribacter sp.]
MTGQMTKASRQSFAQTLSVTRAPALALGANGVIWGTVAAMVPALKAQAAASDAIFGMAILGSAAGGMLAMYLAPRIFARLGRLTLPVLGLFSALALWLPLLATSALLLLPVMAVLGMVVASLDINANLRVTRLEEKHGLHLMNLNHATFSFFFGCAALIVARMRQAGWGVSEVFPTMSLMVALLILGTITRSQWTPPENDPDDVAPAGLPWGPIWLAGVMLFVAFVGENGIETWSALFMERELGGAPGQGSFGPAMLGFSMAAFRLLGHVTTQRFGDARVLLWSGIVGVCGAALLSQAATQPMALIGIGLSAMGLGVVVPTATSLLGKCVHRSQRDVAISRAWMVGFVGFFLGPSSIGLVSELFGLRSAFLTIAVLIALIVPAVIRLGRYRRT